ncbi:hypothetical protein [Nocardia sp. AG03]|uniref:hypothetical protein n=1 Tax=Nocardia sp. AG03 TaxID=3025312 RepID=UPI002418ACC0|nr:hypothetical protein [Nocardia sp. AG03]
MSDDSGENGGVLPIILDVGGIPSAAQQQVVAQLGATQQRVKTATEALTGQGAGTDSDYAVTDERFEGIPAQQLYNAVHGEGGMDITGLATMRGVWNSATTDLGSVSVGMQSRVLALLNDGALTGQAGNAAAAAATRLGQVANQISQVFSAVTGRAEQLYYTAEAVRKAVRQPPTPMVVIDPDDPVQSLIPGIANPETVTVDREAENRVKAENVAAMNTIYKPGYPPAGSGVPAYTFVPAALAGDGGGQGNSSGPGNTNQPTGAGDPSTGTPENDQPTTPTTEDDTPADTGDQADAGDSSDASSDQSSTGSDGDPSTEPAQTTPAGTVPTTVSPGSIPPGGTASPFGSGSPGATPGAGGPLGGAPGASIPGQPSPGGAVSAAVGGSAARPSMSPMMGPMGSGAGQRRGEPDDEHTAPEYLRQVQPDWLEGITTYDSVIGGEAIAAEPNPTQAHPTQPTPPPSAPPIPRPIPASLEPAPYNSAGDAPRTVAPAAVSEPTQPDRSPSTETDAEPSAVSAEIAALLSEYNWAPPSTDAGAAGSVVEPEPGPR